MKHFLFITFILLTKIAVLESFAAYSPNAITMMSCDDGSLTMNHTGSMCAMEVTKTAYNSSGLIDQNIKRWYGIVNINDATAQSVDISSAGFNTVLDYKITVIDNVPTMIIANTVGTSSITLDSYQLSSTGVVVLGINVIGTVSMGVATNLTGLQASISVVGY